MKYDAISKKFDYLIVYQFGDISKNIKDLLSVISILNAHDISVISVLEE